MKPAPIVLFDSVASEPQRLIAESLRSAGWQVETCSLLKGTDYQALATRQGRARWRLRFLMYVVYPLKLLWHVLRAPKASIFIVSSNTFYAVGFAALAGVASRCRVVHLLYDLFPDVLEVAGKVRSNGVIAKAIGVFMRLTQRWCSGTVYIGDFLRQHMGRRWAPARHECTIPVGTDLALFPPGGCAAPASPVSVRYGGNLGYMHDVESIIACVRPFADHQDVRFHFAISGVGLKTLRTAFAGLPINVTEISQQATWRHDLANYPIGLVSLSPGGATVCLPCKIFGMLAAGQAVIAICPAWSDLAQIVRDYDAGWIVNNSPYQAAKEMEGPDYLHRTRAVRPVEEVARDFSRVMEEVQRDADLVQQKRRNARQAAGMLCGTGAAAEKWNAFLAGLPAAGRRAVRGT